MSRYTIGAPLEDLPDDGRSRAPWGEIAAEIRRTPNRWVPVQTELADKSLASAASNISRSSKSAPTVMKSDPAGHWDAVVRQGQLYLRFTPNATSIRKGRSA